MSDLAPSRVQQPTGSVEAAPGTATPSPSNAGMVTPRPARRAWLGLAGLAGIVLIWWLGISLFTTPGSLASQFSPAAALNALPDLIRDEQLGLHILASLRRIAVGLAWAVVLGVPLGFLIGRVRWLDKALTPSLQFLRMVSPLSWMPIAVMSLGVGDPAVYFLLAFAALWPLVMSTAAGVTHIDRRWVQLGESLAATRWEMLWHVYVPGIAAHVLTGVRLAIGILWIVLVPAEMLGVNAGLGYLILDTRDRLAYSELTAVILVIGVLGFALDWAARFIYRRFSGAMQDE
ncbi:nitrate/sulfonate/bicarbonate ABC transporter inner membrane protein [Pandoraea sputorum]|uniref:Bicarbonate transport system permease protein CmpB n=2 Tax=Pandoraea sputorum TaxID=93222 RepID=A0A239SKH2_9BURK|nr:ABC transporter permease [Pandoraea sputorum]SNU85712.1 Bicarbonate transport system permease protein CmpB [Pandoraea sputorum]VVE40063.1 nitrate/sulfonate/bicarbonate ABC transporter inner membrane protein [Pandoraea sputorum]